MSKNMPPSSWRMQSIPLLVLAVCLCIVPGDGQSLRNEDANSVIVIEGDQLTDLNHASELLLDLAGGDVSSFKDLNSVVPGLGMSIQDLISQGDVTTISNIFDYSFLDLPTRVNITDSELIEELGDYFINTLKSNAKPNINVVKENSQLSVTIQGWLEFERTFSVEFDEMLETPNLSLEANGGEIVIKVGVYLDVTLAGRDLVWPELTFSTKVETSNFGTKLTMGMVQIDTSGTLELDGNFSLAILETEGDDSYDFQFDQTLGFITNLSLEGAKIGNFDFAPEAYCEISDSNIFTNGNNFEFECQPDLDSLLTFGLDDGIAFLRTLEDSLIYAAANDNMRINLPLVNKKLSDILDFTGVFTSRLYDTFLMVKPWDDQLEKSRRSIGAYDRNALNQQEFDTSQIANRTFHLTIIPELGDIDPTNETAVSNSDNALIWKFQTAGYNLSYQNADDVVDLVVDLIEEASCEQGCESKKMQVCLMSECVNTTDDDSTNYFCQEECELVVGINADGNLELATNAEYDIDLVGIYIRGVDSTELEDLSLFGLKLNDPEIADIIPSFANIDGLLENMEAVLEDLVPNSVGNVDISLNFEPTVDDEHGHFLIDTKFEKSVTLNADFDVSKGIGADFASVSLEGGFDVSGSIQVEASAGIKFEPEPDATLTFVWDLGEDCQFPEPEEEDQDWPAACSPVGNLEFNLTINDLETVPVTLISDGTNATKAFVTAVVEAYQENDDYENIPAPVLEYISDSSIVLVQFPSATEFSMILNKSDADNSFMLTNESDKISSWHFVVGEIQLSADMELQGDLSEFRANLGRVIEVGSDALMASQSVEFSLIMNPEGYLNFGEWFDRSTNLTNTAAEYFQAKLQSSGLVSGDLSASLIPFHEESFYFSTEFDAFEIDLRDVTGARNSIPEFNTNIDANGLLELSKFSFENVLDVIKEVLALLVGENIKDADIEGCSSGLLNQPEFKKTIPMIGKSACDFATVLQGVVDGVIALEEDGEVTFDRFAAKLETLLQDSIGGNPRVKLVAVVPDDDNGVTRLEIEVIEDWQLSLREQIAIDLGDIFALLPGDKAEQVADFTKSIIPFEGSGGYNLNTSITLQLAGGVERERSSSSPPRLYIKDSTGFAFEVDADAPVEFAASFGPFELQFDGNAEMGCNNHDKVSFNATLDDAPEGRIYNYDDIKLDTEFRGDACANLDITSPTLGRFFTPGNFEIEIPDISKFIAGEDESTLLDGTFPEFKAQDLTLLDLLLISPDAFVEGVDLLLSLIESSTLGSNGIVAKFQAPLIGGAVGRALKAGTPNNIVARARISTVRTLKSRLSGYAGEEDTLLSYIRDELSELLRDLDLVDPEKKVDYTVFDKDGEEISEQDAAPHSVLFILPMLLDQSEYLDLNFRAGNDFPYFPLEFKFDQKVNMALDVKLQLAFGYDIDGGFFFQTMLPEDSPYYVEYEFDATARLFTPITENSGFSGKLGLFTAGLEGTDTTPLVNSMVSLKFGIDTDGLGEGNSADGKFYLSEFQKLSRPSDIFSVGFFAQSRASGDLSMSINTPTDVNYIPSLVGTMDFEYIMDSTDNNLKTRSRPYATKTMSHEHRRLIAASLEEYGSQLTGINSARTEAISRTARILASEEGFSDCKEAVCKKAQINDIRIDIETVAKAIKPMISRTRQYLDKVEPVLGVVNNRIPGVSDIAGKTIRLIDFAQIVDKGGLGGGAVKGLKEIKKFLKSWDALQRLDSLLEDFEDTSALPLGMYCDFLREDSTQDFCSYTDTEDRRILQTTNDRCSGGRECLNEMIQIIRGVDGLTIDFLEEPSLLMGLVTGEDFPIMTYLPEPFTFGVSFEQAFTVFTPPLVQFIVGAGVEITFQMGFRIDSSGIRQAIVTKDPAMIAESFALIDRDPVTQIDFPLCQIVGRIYAGVKLNGGIVTVSLTGGVILTGTVDFYDPNYPESDGLIKASTLQALGPPTNWFEYGVDLSGFIKFTVRVRIKLGFIRITLFRYSISKTISLYSATFIPGRIERPAAYNVDSRALEVGQNSKSSNVLYISSVEGVSGAERVQIKSGDARSEFLDFSYIQGDSVKRSYNLINVASPAKFTSLDQLTLDYEGSGSSLFTADVISNQPVTINGNTVTFGSATTSFEQVDTGKLILPTPDIEDIRLEIRDCNSNWEIEGHARTTVYADTIMENCILKLNGGLITSVLELRFSQCKGDNIGHQINVTSNSILVNGNELLDFADTFESVEIHMSDCDDEITITSVPANVNALSIFGGDGNDKVTLGDAIQGLDTLECSLQIYGGIGDDSLEIDDSGSAFNKPNVDMEDGIISQLISQAIYHSGFENLDIKLTNVISDNGNNLTIGSTAVNSTTRVYGGNDVANNIEVITADGDLFIQTGGKSDYIKISVVDGDVRLQTEDGDDTVIVNIATGNLDVFGGDGNDSVRISSVGGDVVVEGGAGNDKLVLAANIEDIQGPQNGLNQSTVVWRGGLGDDALEVQLAQVGEMKIDIVDDQDGQELRVIATRVEDTILVRENFVTRIQGDEKQHIRIDPSAKITTFTLDLGDGDNTFIADGTFAASTVYGGVGRDVFRVGQLFGSERNSATGVSELEPIKTTLTTKGYLSDGCSSSTPLTLHGGPGDDTFDVLRNRCLLNMYGDSGDDFFTVRGFLEVDERTGKTIEDKETFGGVGLFGGENDDTIDVAFETRYVIDAPVDIDGGTGKNTLIAVGTEADDTFVVTANSISGAGLSLDFINIYRVLVSGEEGNDHIYVLSTGIRTVTEIYGGLGSDVIEVAPKVIPNGVNSTNLFGHTGIIEHTIASDSEDYASLTIPGITVNILDNDLDNYIQVKQRCEDVDNCENVIEENGDRSFTYWIYPTKEPKEEIVVQVEAPRGPNGEAYVLLNEDDSGSLFLEFTNSMEPREVQVKYRDGATQLDIREAYLSINHRLSVGSNEEQVIRSMPFTLIPSRENEFAKSITITETSGETVVAEGDEGFSDEYTLTLRPCTPDTRGNTQIEISPTVQDQVILSVEGQVRDVPVVTIQPQDWDDECVVTVKVTPVNDNVFEGTHFTTLLHHATTLTGEEIQLSDSTPLYVNPVLVKIYDDDSAGVMITQQRDAEVMYVEETPVAERSNIRSDSYTVRLTSAPSENVRILMDSISVNTPLVNGGSESLIQLEVSPQEILFTPSNWMEEQIVTVHAIDDEEIEASNFKVYATAESNLYHIQGPLYLDGGISTEIPSITDPLLLPPDEINPITFQDDLPEGYEENTNRFVNESKQTDTLIFTDIDNRVESLGELSQISLTGMRMGKNVVINGKQQRDGIAYSNFEVIDLALGASQYDLTIQNTSQAIHTIYRDSINTVTEPGKISVTAHSLHGHLLLDAGSTESANETLIVNNYNMAHGLIAFNGNGDKDHDMFELKNDLESVSEKNIWSIDRKLIQAREEENKTNSDSPPQTLYMLDVHDEKQLQSQTVTLSLRFNGQTSDASFESNDPATIVQSKIQNALFDHMDQCGELGTSTCSPSILVRKVGYRYLLWFHGEVLQSGDILEIGADPSRATWGDIFLGDAADTLQKWDPSILSIYTDVENLDISASGTTDFLFNVRATGANTMITTSGGDDAFIIGSNANSSFTGDNDVADKNPGWLDYIELPLHINAGQGSNRILVSSSLDTDTDQSSEDSKDLTLTDRSFTGFLPNGGGEIAYETSGNWISSFWFGDNDNNITVKSIHEGSTTIINTGGGDDRVQAQPILTNEMGTNPNVQAEATLLIANGENGDDEIDTSGLKVRTILFGGEGNDVLKSGDDDDIIFGDSGVVEWEYDGTIVSRFGYASDPLGVRDFTDGNTRTHRLSSAFSRNTDVRSNDEIEAGDGHNLVFGGDGEDRIIAGDDLNSVDKRNIIFGDLGAVEFATTESSPLGLKSLQSLSCGVGGADNIETRSQHGGNDILIGGWEQNVIASGSKGVNYLFASCANMTFQENDPRQPRMAEEFFNSQTTPRTSLYYSGERNFLFGGAEVLQRGVSTNLDIIFQIGTFGMVTFNDEEVSGNAGAHVSKAETRCKGDRQQGSNYNTFPSPLGTEEGKKVIFGGPGIDQITTSGNGDLVFGDCGTVSFDSTISPSGAREEKLSYAESIPSDNGEADIINCGYASNPRHNCILIGGEGVDTLRALPDSNSPQAKFICDYAQVDYTTGRITVENINPRCICAFQVCYEGRLR